jgi:hypothetical protein
MQAVRSKAAARVRRGAKRLPAVDGPAAILTRTEHVEQRELVSWFRKTHPNVRIFAIPNGSQRSRTTGAKLKAEGVSAGVPDLFIPSWLLWIEMKRAKGGAVSSEQKDWIEYLASVGHRVIVARGSADAIKQIEGL